MLTVRRPPAACAAYRNRRVEEADSGLWVGLFFVRAAQALASWNLATKSADTRPRWLTLMPCDSAHARTVFGS